MKVKNRVREIENVQENRKEIMLLESMATAEVNYNVNIEKKRSKRCVERAVWIRMQNKKEIRGGAR